VRKAEKMIRLHFGVSDTGISDTGRLRSQELRLFNTGVPELRKSGILKSRKRHINKEFHIPGNNSISESRIPGVEVSKHFTTGVPKCRIAEMRNKEIPDL
jgi:hypothetical protein